MTTYELPKVPGNIRGTAPRAKKKPGDRQFKVGDKIRVNLHRGRIEEATVKAIIEHTSGKKLQVDFGKDQTALIETWQVVED